MKGHATPVPTWSTAPPLSLAIGQDTAEPSQKYHKNSLGNYDKDTTRIIICIANKKYWYRFFYPEKGSVPKLLHTIQYTYSTVWHVKDEKLE